MKVKSGTCYHKVSVILQITLYDQQMNLCKTCLSPVIHYRHVSTAVAIIIIIIIITVTNKTTNSPNKMLKCISEPLSVTTNVSNCIKQYTHLYVF